MTGETLYNTSPSSCQNLLLEFMAQKEALDIDAQAQEGAAAMRQWYQENDDIINTLADFDSCETYESIYKLITSLPTVRLDPHLAQQIICYLEDLPDEIMQRTPWAPFIIAVMYLNNCHFSEGKKVLLEIVENHHHQCQTTRDRIITGEAYILLGDIAITEKDEQFAAYYQKANEYLPEGSTYRSNRMKIVGNRDLLFLTSNEPGNLDYVYSLFQHGITAASRVMHGCLYGADLLFETEIAYQTGSYKTVPAAAQDCIHHALQQKQYDIAANALVVSIKTALIQGQLTLANQQLHKLESFLEGKDFPELRLLYDCIEGWLYEKTGHSDQIADWIFQELPEYYALSPLNMTRPRLVYANLLFRQGQYAELLELLDDIEDVAQQYGLWCAHTETLILRALAFSKTDRQEMALHIFWQATERCWYNHIVTPFIEHGYETALLAQLAQKSPKFRFMSSFLEEIIKKSTEFSRRLQGNSHHKNKHAVRHAGLTNSEMEILRLLNRGRCFSEICDTMELSLSHVKQITRNLYRKLDATSKADALNTAIAIGIIS